MIKKIEENQQLLLRVKSPQLQGTGKKLPMSKLWILLLLINLCICGILCLCFKY